jgi:predicted DNA-binding transcriptional regulator AlpA
MALLTLTFSLGLPMGFSSLFSTQPARTSAVRLVDRESRLSGRTPAAPFDGERLLTAADVGRYLAIPAKKVYDLPLHRVRLSEKRVRFLESDVRAYVNRQRSAA